MLVDVGLPAAGNAPDLVGVEGGSVTGAGGVSLTVPANAAGGSVVIEVESVDPAALPAGAGGRADFAGALAIDVSGGGLDPTAAYAMGLGTSLPDGKRFAIARSRIADQRSALVLVGFGHSAGGVVVLDACPDGLAACLDGLAGSGTYAVFEIDADAAIVAGTVSDATGPRAGLMAESDASPVASITGAAGAYVLFAPAGATTTFTCRDRPNDLTGSVSLAPVTGGPPILTADISLLSTPPHVTQIDPPNHASAVSRSAVLTVTFSEPVAAASVTDTSVRLLRRAAEGEAPVAVRRSLSSDATRLVLSPASLLEPDTLYRLELTPALTDRTGTPLAPNPLTPNPVTPNPFSSDFTTAVAFRADALPPNTLRVSLPDSANRVFVCGGPQLAVPGTFVDVINDTTGEVVTVLATDLHGASGSDVCDTLFTGRCDTSQPGSFCGVVSGLIGERINVQVEDPFGNLVMLDAGNMRDEVTGAEVIPPEGGVVTFPGDERYEAFVPAGAFAVPTVVQITPITAGGPGLALADFPVLTSLDPAKVELVGAVKLDFEGRAQVNLDISVPAPADAAVTDQYLATQVVNFRGVDEQSMVDRAYFGAAGCAADPGRCLVITDPSVFPGLVTGGIFGIHRALECFAFATGWVSLGDHFNDGYLPGGVLGALLPLPVQLTEPVRFALPVPCNQPVEVEIRTFDEQPIDTRSCAAGVSLSRGEVCELLGVLTDDTKPPAVQSSSVPDGDVGVDPLGPLTVTFDESLDPGSVGPQSCTVEGSHGPVTGRCELSADGRVLAFVPDIRLRYGETYTFRVDGIRDQGGMPLDAPFANTFTTFQPRILQHLDLDARDVVWIDPVAVGRSPCDDLIAVAEGDAARPDFEGGISIYDVTDLSQTPSLVASIPTAGVDRALTVATGALTTTGQNPQTFDGPFLMSVDGPGDPDRFGAWRLFDLSQLPTIQPVAVRLINQSAQSWEQLNLGDPQGSLLGASLELIPNDVGVPLDVASLGTQVSYIANAPHIGLQAIVPQGMNSDFLVAPQVDGTVLGLFRAITTVRDRVLAVRQDGSENALVLVDAQLHGVLATQPLSGGGRLLSVTGLNHWPGRPTFGADQIEEHDLAVALSQNSGVRVVPVDAAAGSFEPGLLANGEGQITTPGGSPHAAVGDPLSQLLFVADGTAGLTIVDLAVPGGSRDEDGDGIDDRVLATVDLDGERAQAVAVYRDSTGALMAVVATGAAGIRNIQVGPSIAEQLALRRTGGGSASVPPPQPPSSPGCHGVEFSPYPSQDGQTYGYDELAGAEGEYVSVDKAGQTQVLVTLEPFDPSQHYWAASNDTGKFDLGASGAMQQLTQAQTVVTIRGTNPPTAVGRDSLGNPKHVRGLLAVRKGAPNGPAMAVLYVELYKKRLVPRLWYYRLANLPTAGTPASTPAPTPTPDAPLPDLDETTLRQRVNHIYKQAVIEIKRISPDRTAVAAYDINGSGCLDLYPAACPNPEKGAIETAYPRDPLVNTAENLRVFFVKCIRAYETCSDTQGAAVAGATYPSLGPSFVTDADGQLVETIVHETLHLTDMGRLNDLDAPDNVMHWATSTGHLLRYRLQAHKEGSGEDMQWNHIDRCDQNSGPGVHCE